MTMNPYAKTTSQSLPYRADEPIGMEVTSSAIWIGQMRRDGVKVDNIIAKVDYDENYTDDAQRRQMYLATVLCSRWNKARRGESPIEPWQPIQTAPKDLPPFERIVLARFWQTEETGEWNKTWQQVGHWFSPTHCWVMDSGGLAGVSGGSCVIALRDDATHWMPLPNPPKES